MYVVDDDLLLVPVLFGVRVNVKSCGGRKVVWCTEVETGMFVMTDSGSGSGIFDEQDNLSKASKGKEETK